MAASVSSDDRVQRLIARSRQPDRDKIMYQMRPYQRELFDKVMDNAKEQRGTVVVCPTGTGKTLVAVSVAIQFIYERQQQHREERRAEVLEDRPGADLSWTDARGPVVFLVTTVALVEQQARQFRQYFTPDAVKTCSGGSKETVHGAVQDPAVQVVVSEVGTFLNALSKNSIKVTAVGLLLFDECHHAVSHHRERSKHPYAQIMESYVKAYLGGIGADRGGCAQGDASRPPLAIGFTASPGIGNDMRAKIDALLQTFATGRGAGTQAAIASVRTQTESLNKFQSRSKERLGVVPFNHVEAQAARFLLTVCDRLEQLITQHLEEQPPAAGECLTATPFQKLSRWRRAGDDAAQQMPHLGQRHTGEYETTLRTQLAAAVSIPKRLGVAYYYAALMDVCHALQVLEDLGAVICAEELAEGQELESLKKQAREHAETFEQTGQVHSAEAQAALEQATAICKRAVEQIAAATAGKEKERPTKLGCLIDVLADFDRSARAAQKEGSGDQGDEEHRALVFVYSRVCCARVIRYIQQNCSEELPLLSRTVSPLIGKASRKEMRGLTQRERDCDDTQRLQQALKAGQKEKVQQKQLDDLREGRSYLLVATSVGEEGIDVPKCNTVIRYDTTFGVASHIQARGRARALQSQFVLVMRPEDERRYDGLRAREQVMWQAVEQLEDEEVARRTSYGRPRWWFSPRQFFHAWWVVNIERSRAREPDYRWVANKLRQQQSADGYYAFLWLGFDARKLLTERCADELAADLSRAAPAIDSAGQMIDPAAAQGCILGVASSSREAVDAAARRVLSLMECSVPLHDLAIDCADGVPQPILVLSQRSSPHVPRYLVDSSDKLHEYTLDWPHSVHPWEALNRIYWRTCRKMLPPHTVRGPPVKVPSRGVYQYTAELTIMDITSADHAVPREEKLFVDTKLIAESDVPHAHVIMKNQLSLKILQQVKKKVIYDVLEQEEQERQEAEECAKRFTDPPEVVDGCEVAADGGMAASHLYWREYPADAVYSAAQRHEDRSGREVQRPLAVLAWLLQARRAAAEPSDGQLRDRITVTTDPDEPPEHRYFAKAAMPEVRTRGVRSREGAASEEEARQQLCLEVIREYALPGAGDEAPACCVDGAAAREFEARVLRLGEVGRFIAVAGVAACAVSAVAPPPPAPLPSPPSSPSAASSPRPALPTAHSDPCRDASPGESPTPAVPAGEPCRPGSVREWLRTYGGSSPSPPLPPGKPWRALLNEAQMNVRQRGVHSNAECVSRVRVVHGRFQVGWSFTWDPPADGDDDDWIWGDLASSKAEAKESAAERAMQYMTAIGSWRPGSAAATRSPALRAAADAAPTAAPAPVAPSTVSSYASSASTDAQISWLQILNELLQQNGYVPSQCTKWPTRQGDGCWHCDGRVTLRDREIVGHGKGASKKGAQGDAAWDIITRWGKMPCGMPKCPRSAQDTQGSEATLLSSQGHTRSGTRPQESPPRTAHSTEGDVSLMRSSAQDTQSDLRQRDEATRSGLDAHGDMSMSLDRVVEFTAQQQALIDSGGKRMVQEQLFSSSSAVGTKSTAGASTLAAWEDVAKLEAERASSAVVDPGSLAVDASAEKKHAPDSGAALSGPSLAEAAAERDRVWARAHPGLIGDFRSWLDAQGCTLDDIKGMTEREVEDTARDFFDKRKGEPKIEGLKRALCTKALRVWAGAQP